MMGHPVDWGWLSETWVGLIWISRLRSRFCQASLCHSINGQTVQETKTESTQPSHTEDVAVVCPCLWYLAPLRIRCQRRPESQIVVLVMSVLVVGIELCVVVGRKHEFALGLALEGLDVTLQQVHYFRVTHLLRVPVKGVCSNIISHSFSEEGSPASTS